MRRNTYHDIRSNGTIKKTRDGDYMSYSNTWKPEYTFCGTCRSRTKYQESSYFKSRKALKKQKGFKRNETRALHWRYF